MSARGRPFQPGNTSGRGRPRGSLNKKSLVLQQLLLDQGGEIIKALIHRAKKGDRTALTLAVERLIPCLKDVAELPVEQPREDSQSNSNQQTESYNIDISQLNEEEFQTFELLLGKTQVVDARSDCSRTPTPQPKKD